MPETTTSRSSAAALTSPLRLALVISFVIAFPLSIAHGVRTGKSTPAVGLVPLFFSALSALAVLRFRSVIESDAKHRDDPDAEPLPRRSPARFRQALTHPIAIFVWDVLLATALMVVLVLTWVRTGANRWNWRSSVSMAMLAAYTTVPLLVGFFVHVALALQSIYDGLAIHRLYQWTAWRAVPPDCPSCNVRLRPSLPELPWLKSFQRRRDGYAPVLTSDVEEDRYRDDADVERGVTDAQPITAEAVEVRKKDRRGKNSSATAESTPWDT